MLNLIRLFGEPKLKLDGRRDFAIKWWCSIITSDFFEKEVLASCMIYPTRCYIWVSASSVLKAQILEHESEIRAAQFLSRFLWIAYKNFERHFQDVWLATRDCVKELFPLDESNQSFILLELMPKWLHRWAESGYVVDENKRMSYLVRISSSLPHSDKERFETTLAKVMSKGRK